MPSYIDTPAEELTTLERELLYALKLMLRAWSNGEDPNCEATDAAKAVIKKAEARRAP